MAKIFSIPKKDRDESYYLIIINKGMPLEVFNFTGKLKELSVFFDNKTHSQVYCFRFEKKYYEIFQELHLNKACKPINLLLQQKIKEDLLKGLPYMDRKVRESNWKWYV